MALRRAFVSGVGMTKFEKPSISKKDYPEMVKEAVTSALKDAGINFGAVEQACVGYVLGDSTSGQRAIYDIGMTGIPIVNVNNNCATGSSALYMAYQLVRGGLRQCVLAVGFEKMDKDNFGSGPRFPNQANPLERHVQVFAENHDVEPTGMTAQLFGAVGREHMAKYGTTAEHFAKIAWKNHKHSTKNPNAQQQQEYSLQEIMDSPMVYEPLTRLQCSPLSHGAAAAVVVSEELLKDRAKSVEILGMEMATDLPSAFEEKSCIKMVGFDMTKKAADALYVNTGITPKDVDVVELHDCFSTNELITYEALGLCPVGKGGEMVAKGDNTYGGKYVVNPSGGLISKGHPLGATGIAQCAELCWHLRGAAGERQVHGAKIGLQHNLGLGGAVVVAMYRMGFPSSKL